MKPQFKIGHGYDIHRLIAGRKLILGGVEIDHHLGLDGHSDADVICHAIMDALLGAASLGDIGTHFPDTNLEYKNADSLILLGKVKDLLTAVGYKIGNIDISVIAERPKLSRFFSQMKSNVSSKLEIAGNDISIKATTNEGIGSLGNGEGIAAFCVALIYK